MCPGSLKVAHTYSPAFPTSNRPFHRLVSALHEFTFFDFNVLVSSLFNQLFGSAALFPLCSSPMLRFQFHHNVSQQLFITLAEPETSPMVFIYHARSSFLMPFYCLHSLAIFIISLTINDVYSCTFPFFIASHNEYPVITSRRISNLVGSRAFVPMSASIRNVSQYTGTTLCQKVSQGFTRAQP